MNNLFADEIKKHLIDINYANKLEIFDIIDSTNTEAKRQIQKGIDDCKIIVASEQTSGRGRLGRTFYSPKDTGIYFTMAIKMGLAKEDLVLITTAVAVLTRRAIERVTGKSPLIKWVNDLYLNDKKVCGILVESVLDKNTFIIGIGINISTDFPDELKEIAGSIADDNEGINKNILVAELINQISNIENVIKERKFIEEYKKYSMVLGKTIKVLQDESGLYYAEDIGENGELILRDNHGNIKKLNSGEVSIRVV